MCGDMTTRLLFGMAVLVIVSAGRAANAGCRKLDFLLPIQDTVLKNHVLRTINVTNEDICMAQCFLEERCVSYNLGPLRLGKDPSLSGEGSHSCELSDVDDVMHPGDVFEMPGYIFRAVKNPCNKRPCRYNSTCLTGFTDKGYQCNCSEGLRGEMCEEALRGGIYNPGTSCGDIWQTDSQENGVYYIRRTAGEDAFQVFCDMEAGGYTLVFKAVSGVEEDVLQTYMSIDTKNEDTPQALNTRVNFKGNYKNRIILSHNWIEFKPSKVRFVLYNNGVEQVVMEFNASSSTYLSWFRSETLLTSWPYTDIKSEKPYFFSVEGPADSQRYFYINKGHYGCESDAGWVVSLSDRVICDWEQGRNFKILYSKKDTYVTWKSGQTVVAEVLAVFVK